MQMVKCENKLGRVEPCSVFWEAFFFMKMVEKLSSIEEVKHKVQFILSLEGVVEFH